MAAEIAMCSRILEFAKNTDMISDRQHAYLEGRSTTTAIFQFTRAILEHLEGKDLALGIFLDLSKAYDCIDHRMLLKKAEGYGIGGNAIRWLQSYLSNRTQRVVIDRVKSSIKYNEVGIPQGSILGPVLFIIFLNDLIKLENNFLITNYADDTNLLIPGSDMHRVLENSRYALETTTNWFTKNKLIMNGDKTKMMLFRTKQNISEKPETVNISNQSLVLQTRTKFLGLIIDEYLSWDRQVDELCLKLGNVGYGISIVSRHVNLTASKILYSANFESSLRYGIIFWGSSSEIQRVFICCTEKSCSCN